LLLPQENIILKYVTETTFIVDADSHWCEAPDLFTSTLTGLNCLPT